MQITNLTNPGVFKANQVSADDFWLKVFFLLQVMLMACT